VLAVYELQVIKIDKQKKEQLRQQILKTLAGSDRVSKELLHKKSSAIGTEDYSKIL
jgi:hypothetical protein